MTLANRLAFSAGLLALSASGALMMPGCASAHRSRANYHNEKAKEELKEGNVGNAIDEKKKSNEAKKDAEKAPF